MFINFNYYTKHRVRFSNFHFFSLYRHLDSQAFKLASMNLISISSVDYIGTFSMSRCRDYVLWEVIPKEVLAFAIDELCTCFLHMLYHVNEFRLVRGAHWFGEFKRTEVVSQMIYTFFLRNVYIENCRKLENIVFWRFLDLDMKMLSVILP